MTAYNISSIRNEIARSVRAVRAACFGRSCLSECARRMAAAAPLRRVRRGGTAAAAALPACRPSVRAVVVAVLALWSLVASANVICVWRQDHYECSGEGNKIDVYSGGAGEEPFVITNIVGTCTNCVAMSPDYVRQWKTDVNGLITFIIDTAQSVKDYIKIVIESVQFLTDDYPIDHSPYYGGTVPITATNYLYSIGYPDGPYANKAASLTFQEPIPRFEEVGLSTRLSRVRNIVYSYDTAVEMYNTLTYRFGSVTNILESAFDDTESVRHNLSTLSDMVDQLSDEQCTAQWDGGSGSSGSLTNQVNGNWCTYDQGEAIKSLLSDIKDWEESVTGYASNILHRVESIDDTIKSALYTTYNHIPTEDQLGTTWQDLYLSGSNDNFPDYVSTNILARIELLVAGMSGVLTNTTEYTEAEDGLDEAEDISEDLRDSLNRMSSDFDNVLSEKSESSRNIGNALIRLYQTFRQWTGAPFSTENIINSYSVEFEQGKALDVPGFAVGSEQVGWANTIRVICRNSMTVVWILFSSWVFIGFQFSFWRWCGKYIKWLIELAQGLFA